MSRLPSQESADELSFPLPPGYRFVRKLGSGGFGEVVEVVEDSSGRHVAYKSLHRTDSRDSLERFEREIRIAASLPHPHSVFILNHHLDQPVPGYTMELMTSGTLKDVVADEGPIAVERAVDWVSQVLQALETMHSAGVVHRDVKPDNCFLTEGDEVKIGDFGLARGSSPEMQLTQTGVGVGTPLYASPEQLQGQTVGPTADVYAAGALLYFLLTGKPPFSAQSLGELIAKQVQEQPAAPVRARGPIPKGLSRAILRALRARPEDRVLSAATFRGMLQPYGRRGLRPAHLGARALAALLEDFFILLAISPLLLGSWILFSGDAWYEEPGPGSSLTLYGVISVVTVAYYGLFEGKLGWSPGKLLIGLRVVEVATERPSVRRSTIRAAIYEGVQLLPGTVWLLATGRELDFPFTEGLMVAALFVSARRRNGARGLHELASGTCVLQRERPPAPSAPLPSLDYSPPDGGNPVELPGLRVEGFVMTTSDGVLLSATDETIGRKVWVHLADAGSSGERVERDARVRGALRWIGRGRVQGRRYYVLEDPGGRALHELGGTVLTWPEVRRALSVLRGVVRRTKRIPSAGELWVDGSRALRVLPVCEQGDASVAETNRMGAVLEHLVDGQHGRPYRSYLPEEAIGILDRLATTDRGVDEILGDLSALLRLPADASRGARWRHIGAAVAAPVPLLLMVGGGLTEAAGAREWLVIGSMMTAVLLSVSTAVAALLSAALHGGPLLKLFGLGIRDTSGRPASRRLCARRSVATWGVSAAIATVFCALSLLLAWQIALPGLAVLALGFLAYQVALARGVRTPLDRWSRTQISPRGG
jgi:hypothetical protein